MIFWLKKSYHTGQLDIINKILADEASVQDLLDFEVRIYELLDIRPVIRDTKNSHDPKGEEAASVQCAGLSTPIATMLYVRWEIDCPFRLPISGIPIRGHPNSNIRTGDVRCARRRRTSAMRSGDDLGWWMDV